MNAPTNFLTQSPLDLVNTVFEQPVPEFNAAYPITHQRGRDYFDEDDPVLTTFVMSLWEELYSRADSPVPPCPHCQGTNTRVQNRVNRFLRVPYFRCRDCRRNFSRLSGTPLARLRFADKMPAFIRLLSQSISLEEASRRLLVDYAALSKWLMRFRELIAQHDPDGVWTARVLLGIKYRLEGACPRCSFSGSCLTVV